MKAFHGKSEIKKLYLDRVKTHAKADEIIKGIYWEKGKGCAVGCTIHSSKHSNYETELGIPMILAKLEDRIFENLPLAEAKNWPLKFLKAIKPGADLSLVWDKFASRLLTDPIGGVIQYAKTEEQIEVIQRVSDLYEAKIIGLTVDRLDFKAAADAAAYSAAPDVAVAVAVVAADAAVDYSAALRKAFIWQSELLLELLSDAK